MVVGDHYKISQCRFELFAFGSAPVLVFGTKIHLTDGDKGDRK